jgi:hypothetical protein
MTSIRDYSTTPASNTSLFPENMNPNAVNDGMREVQAEIKKLELDGGGSLTLGGTATDYTLTLNTTPAALTDGLAFSATCATAATGGSTTLTVTPNGGAAFSSKKIKVFQSGAEGDPTANAMLASGHYLFQYDSAADSGTGAYILLNPSTGSGDVLLAAGSLSSTATDIALTTGFTAYRLIVVHPLPSASGGKSLVCRFSYDSGSTYAITSYTYATTLVTSGTAAVTASVGVAATYAGIGISQSSTSASNSSQVEVLITKLASKNTTGHYKGTMIDTSGYLVAYDGGFVSGSSTVTPTHIRLMYHDGTSFATGTYRLYGLRG